MLNRAAQRAEKTTKTSRRGVDCQDRAQNVAVLPPDAVWAHDVILLPRFFPRLSSGVAPAFLFASAPPLHRVGSLNVSTASVCSRSMRDATAAHSNTSTDRHLCCPFYGSI